MPEEAFAALVADVFGGVDTALATSTIGEGVTGVKNDMRIK